MKDHCCVALQEFGRGFEPTARGWTMRDRSEPAPIGNSREASAEKGEALFQVFTRGAVSPIERMIAWDGRIWNG